MSHTRMAYIALVLLSAAMPAMATPAMAASFNCAIADKPDEVLICQNERLSSLDERMSSLYFRLRNSLAGRARDRLEAEQASWLQQRFGCGRDYDCIRGLYESRIADLANY